MDEWRKYYKVIHVPYGKAGWYIVDMKTGLSGDYRYKSVQSAEKGAMRRAETKMRALERAVWGDEACSN